MENVNLPIDPELGKAIKEYVDQGYVINGVEVLKGFKGAENTYFISLGEARKTSVALTASEITRVDRPKISLPAGKKIGDGEAEQLESQEPMPRKQIPAAESMDPNRPTLKQVVEKILADNKASGKVGAELVKKSSDDIVALPYDAQTLSACQNYLNTLV